MSEVKKYLEFIANSSEKMGLTKRPEWKYQSIEDFLIKNGRPFHPRPLKPSEGKLGQRGQCFKNAFQRASSKHLLYAEGYALQKDLIPMLHAWCVDPTDHNKAIDVTWKYEEETEYFGVILPMDLTMDILVQRRCYGVLDSWDIGWPILTGKYPYIVDHEWLIART